MRQGCCGIVARADATPQDRPEGSLVAHPAVAPSMKGSRRTIPGRRAFQGPTARRATLEGGSVADAGSEGDCLPAGSYCGTPKCCGTEMHMNDSCKCI